MGDLSDRRIFEGLSACDIVLPSVKKGKNHPKVASGANLWLTFPVRRSTFEREVKPSIPAKYRVPGSFTQ